MAAQTPQLYDPAHGIESDFRQVNVTNREQEIFATTQPLSALEVFLDARNTLINGVVRVYAQSAGSNVLIMERAFTTNTWARIARVRGMATSYRVTVQGVALASIKTLSFSYIAYGRGPAQEVGQDNDVTPSWMPRFQVESEASVSPQLLVKGPMFLRQAYGSLAAIGTPSEVTWVQLWNGDITNTIPGTLYAQMYVSQVGQAFSFDFRDPHRLSPNNDGLYFNNGLWLVISTVPFIDSGTFTNTISMGYEVRQAP